MAHSYAESLELCRDAGDTGNTRLGLEGLAAAAAAMGDPTSAARFLGAADAARRTGGEAILPVYDDLFNTTIIAVRELLSTSAFAAAYRDGQTLGIDAAVLAGDAMLQYMPTA